MSGENERRADRAGRFFHGTPQTSTKKAFFVGPGVFSEKPPTKPCAEAFYQWVNTGSWGLLFNLFCKKRVFIKQKAGLGVLQPYFFGTGPL
jgi:hypothetical protein